MAFYDKKAAEKMMQKSMGNIDVDQKSQLISQLDELNKREKETGFLGSYGDDKRREIQARISAANKAEHDNKEEIRMYRGTYGASPDEIDTGLENPMGPDTQAEDKFKKNPMTLQMIRDRSKIRPVAPKAAKAPSNAHLAFMASFDPDGEIYTGTKDRLDSPINEPVTREGVLRMAASRFHGADFSTPEVRQALSHFKSRKDIAQAKMAAKAAEENKPSFWDNIWGGRKETGMEKIKRETGESNDQHLRDAGVDASAGNGVPDYLADKWDSIVGGGSPDEAQGEATGEEDPDVTQNTGSDEEEMIQTQFPDAIKLSDGSWGIRGENGKLHKISIAD